ncbi:DnaJ domain-containing protein [Desulfogranum japonicum]|uniref:DnaJ domain-containing protein n=1 Tax=Desulfogranum japonicum TaxID=231447 RepID=UPI000419C580|nr:DnaJ domain-containing protein [Desulfogranum japonicum]
MEYRQHNQPGCGGCLLIIALVALVTGGAPALLNFLGFLFFSGILSVLVLVALFWGFTYYIQRKVSTYEASQTETHKRFVYLLVHILVKIAQSDGHFTRAELNTILNFFQYNLRYNQDQMYWVKQLIKDARDADVSMEQLLEEFRTSFAYEPRLILLELIYQIIYTKQPPDQSELQQARNIAEFLQISSYDQRTFEAKYTYRQNRSTANGTADEAQYYGVLGLEPGAEFSEIKKAYRKLSMQYHPDKVSHLGDEFKAVAEEKMKEINVAYDYFRKKFGQ